MDKKYITQLYINMPQYSSDLEKSYIENKVDKEILQKKLQFIQKKNSPTKDNKDLEIEKLKNELAQANKLIQKQNDKIKQLEHTIQELNDNINGKYKNNITLAKYA